MPFDGSALSDAARRLIAARNYLVTHGWYRKGWIGSDGQVCVSMAIAQCPSHGDQTLAHKAFARANGITGGIGDWNDAPGRTFVDVLAAFDRAIAAECER